MYDPEPSYILCGTNQPAFGPLIQCADLVLEALDAPSALLAPHRLEARLQTGRLPAPPALALGPVQRIAQQVGRVDLLCIDEHDDVFQGKSFLSSDTIPNNA